MLVILEVSTVAHTSLHLEPCRALLFILIGIKSLPKGSLPRLVGTIRGY